MGRAGKGGGRELGWWSKRIGANKLVVDALESLVVSNPSENECQEIVSGSVGTELPVRVVS